MKKIISILSLSVLLLASCSKSSSPTSTNNGGNGGAGTNQIVATINGTPMTFKTISGSSGSYNSAAGFGVVSFGGVGIDSTHGGASFGIGGGGFPVSTGTAYDVGLQTNAPPTTVRGFAMTYVTKDANGNSLTYGTDGNLTTKVGTITLSSVSTAGAQGTFSASALPLRSGPSGAPSSVSVASGGFNVTFK